MEKKLKAIIYARQSSGDEDLSASVEQQKANCRALAHEKDITVIGEYEDLNVSGKFYPDTTAARTLAAIDSTLQDWVASTAAKQLKFRKGLGKAVAVLKTVDLILVDDYTRFMRPLANSFLEGHMKQLLVSNRVKLLCVKGGVMNPAAFADNLVATLISQINANQLENQRSKSREVLKSRRDTGYRPCGNNFRGYRRIGKNQYEIELNGAKFVQKAFEMGIQNYSYMEICRRLSKEFGIPDLYYDTLITVYRRPEYAGYMYNSTGELIISQEFKDIRLITLDQFNQMQLRLRDKRIHNHDRKNTYAFTGLCYCGYCGERMQIMSSNAMPHSWEEGLRLRFFTCIRNVYREYRKECGSAHIRYQYHFPYGWKPGMPRRPVAKGENPCEAIIAGGLRNLGLYESLMPLVALSILQEKKRILRQSKVNDTLAKLEQRKIYLSQRADTLSEMFCRGSIEDEHFEALSRNLKTEQAKIQEQIIEQLGIASIDIEKEKDVLEQCILELQFKKIDDRLYKKYAQAMIERINVFAYHIEVVFKNQKTLMLERIPHRAARVLPDWTIRIRGSKIHIKYYYKSFFKGDRTEQIVFEDETMLIVTVGRNPAPGEWMKSKNHAWEWGQAAPAEGDQP